MSKPTPSHNRQGGYTIILTLPDIHEPYHIPLTPILDLCDDLNPDVTQFLGDTTNAESCKWRKIIKGIKRDVESVEEDYAGLKKNVLDPFKKAAPKKSKFVYHIGNHERWFYDAMAMDTRAKHKYGLEDNIDLKHYNMELIPLNGVKSFGHLHFTHATYLNDFHTKQSAMNYRRCLVYGHTHDKQSYMLHSPINEREKIQAKSIGCLCDLNPNYLQGKPNKWVHCFNVAYIRKDGTFNDYDIVITDGRFSFNGKDYGTRRNS